MSIRGCGEDCTVECLLPNGIDHVVLDHFRVTKLDFPVSLDPLRWESLVPLVSPNPIAPDVSSLVAHVEQRDACEE